MSNKVTLTAVVVAALLLLPACGEEESIESVDQLLARVCQLAAQCPGVNATQADIDDCPLGIKSQLAPSDLAELEPFLTLSKEHQDRIVTCIGTAICARFGGGLGSISDSDFMEPYRDCLASA